ncbi:GIY-YIG nuclease family protein [Acetobacterium fimetarium]|uniref:GIY-YIG nuclease family protein n=1 Tax=Acetobacterium fimetarium TaxID=52691 RepID=A0ABR6WXF1_9FIRM|nr:GIY-YIG nuclease family protein [Acetobacterium fimetarium]MBC3805123.1 GIY-YIG nuclease family protein [Acetobacterium fimetarium]
MKKSESKKEMIAAYKEQKSVGGVFAIQNRKTGKLFLDVTPNISGMANRFDFAKRTGSCVNIKLKNDWTADGKDSFEFEVLEELEMGEDQSRKSFKEDLEMLKSLWMEKYADKSFY